MKNNYYLRLLFRLNISEDQWNIVCLIFVNKISTHNPSAVVGIRFSYFKFQFSNKVTQSSVWDDYRLYKCKHNRTYCCPSIRYLIYIYKSSYYQMQILYHDIITLQFPSMIHIAGVKPNETISGMLIDSLRIFSDYYNQW